MFIIVRRDQCNPIGKRHAPEGDMNTAALPLFRRQPPKKGQGFLPAALRAPLRSFAAGSRARCVWQRDMALPELREPHRQRRRALSRVSPAELEGRGGRESRGVDALTSAGPAQAAAADSSCVAWRPALTYIPQTVP